ncbi:MULTISPECIES: EscS/YscS/HrcS family type III secretion system export apparatus protein [Acetobacter]|uniref:Flagellar biosynthetic protein FliQ n=1 Tax=Acetobacter thailandicus TaxID=1502842 RepID=A0ABT3QCU3_9PROT|nr:MULTISPECIES: flagellar biosynthetic protein FliQ [Acetobacter]MBS0960433.1 flagellar biosynthetic protein FliQ [Acetobacter thailandicus]MBS0979521.1 flagellar biosynthetic protein FliQ [Acetobacter thailandicus]MBS0986060.1 flagellar biosynthetic protein FliQ [Acetobacter thailandicus]MBS1004332.1 flagellar biosynthetic protein FliQ [Acetobacter thailandicus]MCX2563095.1 flagellar biosynthetic protein FliQ [Acetobacter thailandicus]
MDDASLTQELSSALFLFASIAGPPLAVALIVGLVVGLMQAVTQLQDQTMPLTFKVVAVCATLLLMASTLFPPLLSFTERILNDFPTMTRY